MKKDPICGKMVDENKTKWRSDHKGKKYYFCSEKHKLTFDENPKRFAAP
jgi:YHS domain-containing protein